VSFDLSATRYLKSITVPHLEPLLNRRDGTHPQTQATSSAADLRQCSLTIVSPRQGILTVRWARHTQYVAQTIWLHAVC